MHMLLSLPQIQVMRLFLNTSSSLKFQTLHRIRVCMPMPQVLLRIHSEMLERERSMSWYYFKEAEFKDISQEPVLCYSLHK